MRHRSQQKQNSGSVDKSKKGSVSDEQKKVGDKGTRAILDGQKRGELHDLADDLAIVSPLVNGRLKNVAAKAGA